MTENQARHRPAATPRRAVNAGVLLVVLSGVQAIDAFDVASMGPALPEIQRDLGMSPASLQWVITAHVLGYGGLLAGVTWRLVLFVPAVLAVALLVAAARVVPRRGGVPAGARPSVDVLGAVTVTGGLLTLVHGVSRTAETGWGRGVTLTALGAAGRPSRSGWSSSRAGSWSC